MRLSRRPNKARRGPRPEEGPQRHPKRPSKASARPRARQDSPRDPSKTPRGHQEGQRGPWRLSTKRPSGSLKEAPSVHDIDFATYEFDVQIAPRRLHSI
eukprot:5527811-Pyramimonas_sp.AAC.1